MQLLSLLSSPELNEAPPDISHIHSHVVLYNPKHPATRTLWVNFTHNKHGKLGILTFWEGTFQKLYRAEARMGNLETERSPTPPGKENNFCRKLSIPKAVEGEKFSEIVIKIV